MWEKLKVLKETLNKKTVTLCAMLMALCLLTVPATMSYLSASSGRVVNTFAAGAIQLTLDEAKVDAEGNPAEGAARVTENNYSMVPGATLSKDPTVTVLKGSVTCYVFLYVDNPLPADYFDADYSDSWLTVAASGTATLYVYESTVSAADGDVTLPAIFTQIRISEDLTDEMITDLSGSEITIEAYAVQVTGITENTAVSMAEAYFADAYSLTWEDTGEAEIEGAYTGDEQEETEGTEESAETGNTDAADETTSGESVLYESSETAEESAGDDASDDASGGTADSSGEEEDGSAGDGASADTGDDDTVADE